jgi:hypothetical protein
MQSSYPTAPDDRIDQPAYHLAVHSDPSASTSSAQLGESTVSGIGEGGVFSTASVVEQPDGALVSEATSRADVAVGPLKLTGFQSTARVVRAPDGSLTRTSSVSVGKLTLGSLSIGLTARGLVLGTSTVPLNALGAVSSVVSFGSTRLSFVPASSTADSILSAGLELTTSQMVAAIGHPVNVSYLIGRTFAAGDSSTLPSVAPPSILPIGGNLLAPAGTTSPPSAPSLAAGPGGFGGTVASRSTAAPLPSLAGPRSTRRPGSPQAYTVASPLLVSTWTFYPIVALGGLVVLAAALGRRIRGRLPWSS